MVSPRKFLTVLVLLLAILLVLSACEMPIPGSGDPTATLDPNVGGGTDGTPQSEPGDGQTQPTPETGDQAQPTADPGGQAQPTPESGDQAQPTPQPTDQTQPTAVPTPVPTPIPTAVPPTPVGGGGGGIPPTQEVIHIVQPGENLFRIGLQYGYSWTVLAQYNGIPNPNFVVVGQAIRIPPAGGTGGSGGQPPDGNFTYYVVQPGDNLFRIGLRFGMSWTYIAEANGIVNPHYIVTGQVLKIPVIS